MHPRLAAPPLPSPPPQVKQHIFGVIFCMSSVQSDFSDVSPKLREVCEVMSPHLLFMLTQPLANDYKVGNKGACRAACAHLRRAAVHVLCPCAAEVYNGSPCQGAT